LFPRIAKNVGGEGLRTAADKTSPHLGIKRPRWTDLAARMKFLNLQDSQLVV